jgi:hypothetical protein
MNLTGSATSSPELAKNNSHVSHFLLPIIVLALLAAIAHFYLAAQPDEELHNFFLLNGFGYLVLILAFLLPRLTPFHELIRWILIGYATLTIILWFFFGSPSEGALDPFDLSVKLVELALVILLILDKKREAVGAR